MTRNSIFLDRGAEVALFYPAEVVEDRRGNRVRQLSAEPVEIRVSVSKDRGSVAELPGNVDNTVMRCVTRWAPDDANSWSRIVFRGQEWDMAVPPFPSGWSGRNRHWEFVLRSRNRGADDE